jgi:hypothetical protein
MATVTYGNPVVLDATFAQEDQTPPDTVSFEVQAPDQTVTGFDGAPQVTNPSGNYWECALGVPADVGEYRWRATGYAGSTVTETIYGTLFVIASAVDPDMPPPAPPGPTLGPCFTWITGDDVAACARVDYGSNPAVFDTVAYEASMALYEISGRQFPSVCERTVRPCRIDCDCWLTGPISYGMGPWFWTTVPWGFGGGWAWYNERGDRFGCAPMSKVNLAGYPVREILQVLIDGVELPEFDPDKGYRNWRLDKWRYLVRMDTPGNPAQPNFFPACQQMSLDDDQPGTFSISYKWGIDPPPLGRGAAVEIANQLYLACGGRDCVLPVGATRVVRQGIEVDRGLLANWLDTSKGVGLVQTDLFLQAYCGGQRRGRRSAIWSPDLQTMARRVGTGQDAAS